MLTAACIGNDTDYEQDRRRRLGTEADQPHCIQLAIDLMVGGRVIWSPWDVWHWFESGSGSVISPPCQFAIHGTRFRHLAGMMKEGV